MRGSPLPLHSHLPSTLPDLLSAFRDLSVRFLPDVLSFSQCLPNDSVCYYAIYHTYLIRFCQVEPVILLTVRCLLLSPPRIPLHLLQSLRHLLPHSLQHRNSRRMYGRQAAFCRSLGRLLRPAMSSVHPADGRSLLPPLL